MRNDRIETTPGAVAPVPDRILRLEKDRRGYPIPWNVLRGVDNVPIFTVNDERRNLEALQRDLCPICGERLGKWRWWVGGPKAAFDEHGWYLDLPVHQECARFALQTCPYLASPRYAQDHRVDVADPSKLLPEHRILVDQTMENRRPQVFVAVCSDRGEMAPNDPLLPYTRPRRPVKAYEFWLHGKQIPTHRAMPVLRGLFGAAWELPACQEEL